MTCDFDWLQPERLVILDIFGGQTTEAVQNLMKELHITPIYIPERCTGYVQPLDTIPNKLLKDRIATDLEEVIDDAVTKAGDYDDNVGTRRIAITHAVARAWKWLHRERQASIIKCFEQAGISLPADGSQDHKLKIRGLPDFKIKELETEEDMLEFDIARHAVDAA